MKRGGKAGRVPPSGSVRRSQLLSGAGPGAVLDLVDDAVLVGGLDSWRYPNDGEGFLAEPRLQAKVQALLRETGWWEHGQARLRMPPSCDEDQPSERVGIPCVRFPRWFVCQNPECRSLVQPKGLQEGRHVCRHDKKASFPVVPIRFVTACPKGHIQDIDWRGFVHRWQRHGEGWEWCKGGQGYDWTADLYLQQVGTSGDLSDQVLVCRKCGAVRGLQDLGNRKQFEKCAGRSPWLSQGGEAGCDAPARLITRTASNAYFASTVSALSIPDPAEGVRTAVEEEWGILQAATAQTLPAFRTIPAVKRALEGRSDAEVLEEIERRRLGLPAPTPPLREMEAEALMAAPWERAGELPKVGERWHARRAAVGDLPDFVERVVLVKHLTEVRAQIGFTRIDAQVGDAEGEYALDVYTAPLGGESDWVPTVEIHGEGVYVALRGELLDAWTAREAVKKRAKEFREAAMEEGQKRGGTLGLEEFAGERLVLLHTLSHLLITSIALECGYGAASIRERLYCAAEPNSKSGPGEPEFLTTRAGILLYTGSPGSEGTLGGLVEVGRRVGHHLRRAAQMGMLCSNDPVCGQHNPNDGQEGRHREGAACHGCVLIGEPSCERRNLDLDRALLVPLPGKEEMAFLGAWVDAGMP